MSLIEQTFNDQYDLEKSMVETYRANSKVYRDIIPKLEYAEVLVGIIGGEIEIGSLVNLVPMSLYLTTSNALANDDYDNREKYYVSLAFYDSYILEMFRNQLILKEAETVVPSAAYRVLFLLIGQILETEMPVAQNVKSILLDFLEHIPTEVPAEEDVISIILQTAHLLEVCDD